MDDFEVRFIDDGDASEIVELLDSVFKGWPKFDLRCSQEEHWAWKHRDNPVNRSVVLTSTSGGKVIGVNHSLFYAVRLMGLDVLCVMGSDLAVHPEYRRMGIRTVMRDRKFERLMPMGVSFIQSISGNPIIVDHSIRENLPHFPHPVAGYVLIRDIDLHMERMPVDQAWVKKTGYKALSTVKKVGDALFGKRRTHREMRVVPAERFPSEVDTLWDAASKRYDYIGVRDSRYLNWRYCDPRSGPFTTLLAYDGDRLVGYLVYAVNSFIEDYPLGYIVDLLTLPDMPEAADLLMGEALEAFRVRNVNIVNGLAVKGSQLEEDYKTNGFLDSLVRLHMFLRPVASQTEIQRLGSLTPDRIHFTWGDHDTLPLTTGTDSL